MFKHLVVVTATVEESLVTLEVESVNGTALGASVVLQGVVDVEPNSVVGVNGETSAANLSLGEERVDGNRFVNSTKSGNLKRLHVENVNTLEVTEEFESLETSRLVLVIGHLTGLGTRTKQLGRAVAGRPGGRDGEGSGGEGRGGDGSSEGGEGGAEGSNSGGHFGCLEEWGVREDVKKKDREIGRAHV